MKIAVLLKGIFYMPFYSRKNRMIDYRLCLHSFKEFFKNHEVDYYISSYKNELQNDILDDFKPVSYEFRPYNDLPVFNANNLSIIKVLELFLKKVKITKKEYDFIIVTRPDITFDITKKFEDIKLSVNHNCMMLMQLKNRNGFCEDNFNIVGLTVINEYIQLIKRRLSDSHHSVLRRFCRLYPNKVILYNYLNFNITPGLCSFYRLIKISAPLPSVLKSDQTAIKQ